MNTYFDKPLFIFEMANNHMGDMDHGLRMIREFGELASRFPYRFAFKFQFRQLDTFIHPDYVQRTDLKYIRRFRETALTPDDFRKLKEEAVSQGFIPVCTPFDEPSVDLMEALDIAIIKIASCSFTDWPLLERIAGTDRPVIASTAGATLDEMDKVISFLQHRSKQFAIMHCIGEYPTLNANLQLNQIDMLRRRYPGIPVGFSTHEDPEQTDAVKLAVAKGAVIFEKHVAVETKQYKKNDYSATPSQTVAWLESAREAFEMCGLSEGRPAASEKELADLRQFKRGVFAKERIPEGGKIDRTNIFFAFPNAGEQLVANDMSKYNEYRADRDIEALAPLMISDVTNIDQREKVYSIVQRVKKLLKQASVVVPGRAELEISHHYGIERFEEYGCTIISIVNREYCKKLIIVLPGQNHPEQYHKVKEETFVVLYGDVTLTLDGKSSECKAGDIITVDRGMKHIFSSQGGAVIEEISSTHFRDDSYYTDPEIAKNINRKTVLTYWMN
jgi:sialic acid synthase SpsE/quercetin dioxygenase-like cupin family protein